MDIHLIEKQNLFETIDIQEQIYESGFWAISEDTAKKSINGNIYFHKGQTKPSHFGGVILKYRVQNNGMFSGRIVFIFRAMIDHKNVKTSKTGWSNEKKIVE